MNDAELRGLFQRFDWENPPEYPAHYPPPALWAPGFSAAAVKRAWRAALSRRGDLVMYVHVPFCREICGFCGFNARRLDRAAELDRWLDLLEKEVALLAPLFSGKEFMWLCFGGGTPSLLSGPQLERLFGLLRKRFRFVAGGRVAFEAHPDSLDEAKIKKLKALGVDWLSIGVQTFDDGVLRRNGRRQDAGRVPALVRAARRAGIKNVQLDLLAGMPFQTEEIFARDVAAAAALKPERIYLFPFQRKRGVKLEAAEAPWLWDAYRRAVAGLQRKGYDISCGRWLYRKSGGDWPYSYDQGEKISRDHYSVLGLGPGAISYARLGARYRNEPGLKDYGAALSTGRLPAASGASLTLKDELRNLVLLSLLQRGELPDKDFAELAGKKPESVFPAEFAALKAAGLLSRSGRSWLLCDRESGFFELRKAFYPPAAVKAAARRLGPGPAANAGRAKAPAAGAARELPAAGLCAPGRAAALKAAGLREAELRLGWPASRAELAGLRNAEAAGIKLRLNIPVTPANAAALGKAVEFFSSAGARPRFRFLFGAAGPAAFKKGLKAVARLVGAEITADGVPPCLAPAGSAINCEPLRGGGADAGVLHGAGTVKPRACYDCSRQLDCGGLPAACAALGASLKPLGKEAASRG